MFSTSRTLQTRKTAISKEQMKSIDIRLVAIENAVSIFKLLDSSWAIAGKCKFSKTGLIFYKKYHRQSLWYAKAKV